MTVSATLQLVEPIVEKPMALKSLAHRPKIVVVSKSDYTATCESVSAFSRRMRSRLAATCRRTAPAARPLTLKLNQQRDAVE